MKREIMNKGILAMLIMVLVCIANGAMAWVYIPHSIRVFNTLDYDLNFELISKVHAKIESPESFTIPANGSADIEYKWRWTDNGSDSNNLLEFVISYENGDVSLAFLEIEGIYTAFYPNTSAELHQIYQNTTLPITFYSYADGKKQPVPRDNNTSWTDTAPCLSLHPVRQWYTDSGSPGNISMEARPNTASGNGSSWISHYAEKNVMYSISIGNEQMVNPEQ